MRAGTHSSYLRALFCAALLVAAVFAAASEAPQVPMPSGRRATHPVVNDRYGKLPLSFEANKGQTNSAVRFLSRGKGYTLFLTRNEAVLALGGTNQHTKSAPHQDAVLRMELARASGWREPRGEERLPGTANYFLGADPAKWRTGVPIYAEVRYSDIYPGIDLVYYGNQRQLEFDFVVAPGADPGAVAMDVGARGDAALRITGDGDLVIPTTGGEIRFLQPLVYQMVDGHRHPVAGGFALLGKHRVGFRLGSYDRAKALVIDPALVYSTFLGGSGGDTGNAIAVDSAGNAYVAGWTASTDFPVTPGAFQTANHVANGTTAFVTKLNPSGTVLVYSTYLGGSGNQGGGDTASAIAVDAAGNAYVTGQTFSTDFPVTQGAFQTVNRASANGEANGFVAKLNPAGAALLYSTYLGGSGLSGETTTGDKCSAIAVDAAGDAYVTGTAFSIDFPTTSGSFQTTNHATHDGSNAFVTKLNAAGAGLAYSTYLGGSGARIGGAGDFANAIAVDAAGEAFLTGDAVSSDFPVTPGAFQSTNTAAANLGASAFVTKLNSTGTALMYSTYLGGGGTYGGEDGSAIAVDAAGSAYVAGRTSSTEFPVTEGAFQTSNHSANGGGNAFVSKLNSVGTALVFSTYLGGSGGVVWVMPTLGAASGDQASGLVIDSSGDVYVTGRTASADFPVTQGAFQTTNHDQPPCAGGCIGGYNAFITELNAAGSALVYSTYLGGNGINPADFVGVIEFGDGDTASALALDNSGNVYVTGSAISYDFPVTAGAFQTTVNSGLGNAFVAKLNMGATSTTVTPTLTVTPSASTITSARPLTVTVSVSGGNGQPVPSGTVTLASGTYSSGATTLNQGSATFDIPAGSLLAEPAGYLSPDELLAEYVPDVASSSTYNSSSGMASVYVVAPYIAVTPSSTTLTWAQSQSQALPVAMVATGGSGNPTPTGAVTLTTGKYSSGAIALSGGSASASIPPATLTTGFNVLNVSYSGDSNYAALPVAGSNLVTVGAVTVSVVPSSSTINSTQALQVAITVSAGSGSPTATGMVVLVSSNYTSETTPLAGGSATITIPAGTLPFGVDTLQVSYADGNYAGASGRASVTVMGPNPGFTIAGTPVTVTAGATSGNVSTVTLTSTEGFSGTVALTVALTSSPGGAQKLPTLSFGGNTPVSISGAAPTSVPLTISTSAGQVCAQGDYETPRGIFWFGGTALASLLAFSVREKRRRRRFAVAMLALVTLVGSLLACGGGGSPPCTAVPGTTAGAYLITVTGTSGATTATGTVSLTVQ